MGPALVRRLVSHLLAARTSVLIPDNVSNLLQPERSRYYYRPAGAGAAVIIIIIIAANIISIPAGRRQAHAHTCVLNAPRLSLAAAGFAWPNNATTTNNNNRNGPNPNQARVGPSRRRLRLSPRAALAAPGP